MALSGRIRSGVSLFNKLTHLASDSVSAQRSTFHRSLIAPFASQVTRTPTTWFASLIPFWFDGLLIFRRSSTIFGWLSCLWNPYIFQGLKFLFSVSVVFGSFTEYSNQFSLFNTSWLFSIVIDFFHFACWRRSVNKLVAKWLNFPLPVLFIIYLLYCEIVIMTFDTVCYSLWIHSATYFKSYILYFFAYW